MRTNVPMIPVLGDNLDVPVWDGSSRHYINLDNAATTPPFKAVWDMLSKAMPYYGSIHRGAGYKSVVSTHLFEEALLQIMKFTDSNPDDDVLIFSYNTTACINHLERRLALDADAIVIVAENEHSSNLLPWRKHAQSLTCKSSPEGTIDYQHLEELLKNNQVSIVAVAAASNVTGALTDIHLVARLAHTYGAEIFVDASQLVAHRPIIRKPKDDPDHIDFLAFAGHKMYAPFGTGVLVANKKLFRTGWPEMVGGGTIRMIDGQDIIWSELPNRETGGTPNYTGIITLAEASRQLITCGYDQIREHEKTLITAFKEFVASNDAVTVYRHLDPLDLTHLAIFPFSVAGFQHGLVSAYLGIEKAIGVRSGHLCQFALVSKFLNLSKREMTVLKQRLNDGDDSHMYGVVRASCGLANTPRDIQQLGEALDDLLEKGPAAPYQIASGGQYIVEGWAPTL